MKNELKRIRMSEFMMTAREFAAKLETEYTTYKNWEYGVNQPTLEKALQISSKLNRPVESIWHL